MRVSSSKFQWDSKGVGYAYAADLDYKVFPDVITVASDRTGIEKEFKFVRACVSHYGLAPEEGFVPYEDEYPEVEIDTDTYRSADGFEIIIDF